MNFLNIQTCLSFVCGLIFFKMDAQVIHNVYNNFDTVYTHHTGELYYGTEGFSVIIETVEGLKLIGTTMNLNFQTQRNHFIVDINSEGELLRQSVVSMSLTGTEVSGRHYLYPDGSYFLFGFVSDDFSINSDGMLTKLNSEDSIEIQYTYSFGQRTSFTDYALNKINQGASFYILAFADTDTTSGVNQDIFIAHIDSGGNVIFNYQYGGIEMELGKSIYLLDNGNLLVAGETESFGAGRRDFYLFEADTLGNMLWQQTYGYPGHDQFGFQNGLYVTGNEEFYLCGSTELQNGNQVAWLIKTDRQGNVLWEKKYNKGPAFDYFKEILPAHDGTLILIGNSKDYSMLPQISNPMTWVVKMDTSGNIIWERLISMYDPFLSHTYANQSIISSDGGIVMAGYVIANYIETDGVLHMNDAWLCKTDSCGFTVGDVPEPLFWHAVGSNNTVYIQNRSENYCTATLSWGDGSADEHIYAYSEPIYGYSPNLAHTYTEPGTYEICLEALAGEEFRSYCTEVTVMPNSLTAVAQQSTNFRLFPNPSSGYVVVEMVEVTSTGSVAEVAELVEATCKAYNLNGQLVAIFPLLNQVQQKLDISHLSPGVYVMNLEKSGEYIGSQKLVVVR